MLRHGFGFQVSGFELRNKAIGRTATRAKTQRREDSEKQENNLSLRPWRLGAMKFS
jgi:hypothetical protein